MRQCFAPSVGFLPSPLSHLMWGALTLSTLLLVLVPSLAGAATCATGFNWTYNSQGQSPCDVAASLLGVCVPAGDPLPQLPPGYYYIGPTLQSRNECTCSSVYFSMLSACAVCQTRETLRWSTYATNCSTVYVQTFPDPLPTGVRVPHYAYLDVTNVNGFDASVAQAAGGTESVSVPSATTVAPGSSSTGNQNSGKKTNAGAIAGGVVGGVAVLGIIVCVVVWFLLRQRDNPSAVLSQDMTLVSYASSIKTQQQPYNPYPNTALESHSPLEHQPFNLYPNRATGSHSPPMHQPYNPYPNTAPGSHSSPTTLYQQPFDSRSAVNAVLQM